MGGVGGGGKARPAGSKVSWVGWRSGGGAAEGKAENIRVGISGVGGPGPEDAGELQRVGSSRPGRWVGARGPRRM